MKNIGFFLTILAMAALNWSASTRKIYPDSQSKIGESSAAQIYSLSVLIGIALMALLLHFLYRHLREVLDRGVVTYPRFRIPASLKLFPYRYAYTLLLFFFWGMSRTGVTHGGDARGPFDMTVEWNFGSQCSMMPFLMAAICITLWNILQGVTMESPSNEAPIGLVSHRT